MNLKLRTIFPLKKVINSHLICLEADHSVEATPKNSFANQTTSKVLKKSKCMSKEEFVDMLKKAKLNKIIKSFKEQQMRKKKKLQKRFYHIEDHEEKHPIHYLEKNYEQLVKERENEMERLQTIFNFPFQLLKNSQVR
jgi:hypothetical protein